MTRSYRFIGTCAADLHLVGDPAARQTNATHPPAPKSPAKTQPNAVGNVERGAAAQAAIERAEATLTAQEVLS